MPYIKKQERSYYDNYIAQIEENIATVSKKDTASIAYVIYKLLVDTFKDGDWDRKADTLKILKDVELQYWEDVLKPYAKLKKKENGDVF